MKSANTLNIGRSAIDQAFFALKLVWEISIRDLQFASGDRWRGGLNDLRVFVSAAFQRLIKSYYKSFFTKLDQIVTNFNQPVQIF